MFRYPSQDNVFNINILYLIFQHGAIFMADICNICFHGCTKLPFIGEGFDQLHYLDYTEIYKMIWIHGRKGVEKDFFAIIQMNGVSLLILIKVQKFNYIYIL